MNNAHAMMDINVKIRLEKDDLESIIDNIVTPFYEKIRLDNSVSGFVNDAMLHGLKVKQCLFVSLFLTQELKNLQKFMVLANIAHQRINIDVKLILPYFFIWCDLIEKWLKENKKIDDTLLNNWKNKQYALIGHMFRLNEDMLHAIEDTDISSKDNRTKNVDAIIEKSKSKKTISAKEFFQSYQVNSLLIQELVELESEIDEILLMNKVITTQTLLEVSKVYLAYSHILEDTKEFLDLSYALDAMHLLLTKDDIDLSNNQKNQQLHTLIEAMIMDLRIWRKAVFEDQTATNIHFLDASILSSVTQLEVLLANTKYDVKEEFVLF